LRTSKYFQRTLSGLIKNQDKSEKNSSFSLIERVILSAGAMLYDVSALRGGLTALDSSLALASRAVSGKA
jgi:hypothetical protein